MSQPTLFSEPCNRAYDRMKTILFRPFDAGKWFILGFSAWLATLGEGGGGSYQGDLSSGASDEGEESGSSDSQGPMEEFNDFWNNAMEWLQENPWIIGVAVFGMLLFLGIGILICWLNARGKFMFLDNVVHNRAEVALPWREYRAEGNSLFRWVICFHLMTGAILLTVLAGTGYSLFLQFRSAETFTGSMIAVAVVGGLVFGLLLLVIGYIWTLLTHLVVPQMYKHRMAASEAWKRIMKLQRERAGSLVLFFLLNILLGLLSGLILVAFVLGTCCIGLIPLVIPYLGAVIMLPITVFFCALGPEFSRQFGTEFDLWPELPAPVESP